ncbi:MAG: diaminopimelate decarboxylase [Pirellulales bacterium]|nr:diaminopimelate decarboxylase [Pirellulales bacterium]
MPNPSEPKTLRDDVAGVVVMDLVRRFGTPTFVYDAAVIRRRIADLAAFDCIRYAVKACSNLAILELMRSEGAAVDCVSAGEVRRALAAGYSPEGTTHSPLPLGEGQGVRAEPPINSPHPNPLPKGEGISAAPPIMYTADVFDRESLDLCVEKNVTVNCGSPDMIDQWGRRKPGTAITLRINPGFGHGHSRKTNTGGKSSKHGIWHTQLADCLERAKQYGLKVAGLHMHIGSGTDLEHLAQVCGVMEQAAAQVGPTLEMISAGGGLPVIYQPGDATVDLTAYFKLWNNVRKRLVKQFDHPLRLEIEPGRYLTAESGYLLTEIRAVKHQDDNLFYLLDAGFNNLARPILYGAYHPMSIAWQKGAGGGGRGPESVDTQSLIPNPQSPIPPPEHDVIVGGPLCESGDIFTQEMGGFVTTRRLPAAQVGDVLIIECAGAYGFVMGSNYNSRPLAAEVLIDHQSPRLIRRRQTFEEMIQQELR